MSQLDASTEVAKGDAVATSHAAAHVAIRPRVVTRKRRQGKPDAVKRPKRQRETDDFAKGIARLVRAFGRRVSDGDVEELRLLAELRTAADKALHLAVRAQRQANPDVSWARIGAALGVTKQSAQERYGRDA